MTCVIPAPSSPQVNCGLDVMVSLGQPAAPIAFPTNNIMPNSQQPSKLKQNVGPGPLNLYLEKKDPPVNEDEQDSLYTPSPKGHRPTSASSRKKKGVKGSNNSSNSE